MTTHYYFADGGRRWAEAGAAALTASTVRLHDQDAAPSDLKQQLVDTLVALSTYADQAQLDLWEAMPTAAETYAALRRQSPFLSGLAVTDGLRNGVLVDTAQPERGTYIYQVWFPSTDTVEDRPSQEIKLADFPRIELCTHEVRTPGRALEELAQRQADYEHAQSAREPVNYFAAVDRDVLVEDFTRWSESTEEQLLRHLRPRIDRHRTVRATATPPGMAAGDFAKPQPPAPRDLPSAEPKPALPQQADRDRVETRDAGRTR